MLHELIFLTLHSLAAAPAPEDAKNVVGELIKTMQRRQQVLTLLVREEARLRTIISALVCEERALDVEKIVDRLLLVAADAVADAASSPSASLAATTHLHLQQLNHQQQQHLGGAATPTAASAATYHRRSRARTLPPVGGPHCVVSLQSTPTMHSSAEEDEPAGNPTREFQSFFSGDLLPGAVPPPLASYTTELRLAAAAAVALQPDWVASSDSLLGPERFPSTMGSGVEWPTRRTDRTKTSPANCVASQLADMGTRLSEEFSLLLNEELENSNNSNSNNGSNSGGNNTATLQKTASHRIVSFSPDCDETGSGHSPSQQQQQQQPPQQPTDWVLGNTEGVVRYPSLSSTPPPFTLSGDDETAATTSTASTTVAPAANSVEAHLAGVCKPCAFYYSRRKFCAHGAACGFCHHTDHQNVSIKQWKKSQQASKFRSVRA